ncbi:MAG: Spy/CpxP family protein refolding chaperone [Planctomycetota bacterium]
MFAATGPNAGSDTPLRRFIMGNIGRLLVLRSEMNVTPDQQTEIRAVLLEHREELAATGKSVRSKRNALRDLVLSSDAQEADIRAAAGDLAQVIGDAAVKAAELRREIAPLLTDQQRARLQEFRDERDQSFNQFFVDVFKGE